MSADVKNRVSSLERVLEHYIESKDLRGEFDIVAADKDRVYVVEVKSTPDRWGINKFIARIPVFRQLFPEYDDKELVPIFGSLSFPDDLIDYASKKGIYVLAYREWESLNILNFDAVRL